MLRANGFELTLHIEGHEFSQFRSGWDANALRCQIELDIQPCGSLHASHRPIIYTVELERSHGTRERSTKTAQGQASFEHEADEIGVTVRLNCGTGTLEGFPRRQHGGRLSFENIHIDQRSSAKRSRSSTRSSPASPCAAASTMTRAAACATRAGPRRATRRSKPEQARERLRAPLVAPLSLRAQPLLPRL